MTSNLRKAHKVIWIALAIAVPVLLVFSVLGIQASPLTDAAFREPSQTEEQRQVLDNDDLFIGLTSNSIQVILKKPLKSPASVAYSVSKTKSEEVYLGTLGKKGIYNFPVDRSVQHIRIYDGLKKDNLLTVTLPWD